MMRCGVLWNMGHVWVKERLKLYWKNTSYIVASSTQNLNLELGRYLYFWLMVVDRFSLKKRKYCTAIESLKKQFKKWPYSMTCEYDLVIQVRNSKIDFNMEALCMICRNKHWSQYSCCGAGILWDNQLMKSNFD